PCVTISDRPKYAWRGMHLDVSRHFLPPEEIETLIDAMALHRLNVLHLHLTDDQGWRIQIKGYQRLTEVGAWRDRTLVGHTGAVRGRGRGVLHVRRRPARRCLHLGGARGRGRLRAPSRDHDRARGGSARAHAGGERRLPGAGELP